MTVGKKRSEGYRFIDKDPILDLVKTAMKDSGLSRNKIAELSGVAWSTLHNWEFGETRRPQNLSITMVMAGLGYRQVWRDMDGAEIAPADWRDRSKTKRRVA